MRNSPWGSDDLFYHTRTAHGTELHGALRIWRGSAFVPTNTPGSRLRIVLSNYPRGHSKNEGVIRDASRHHRIDRDNTIAAYYQLSSWAYDGRPMGDPRSLANSDSAALRKTLVDNWYREIFVRVIVVHNDDLLADEHIMFQVD
jgi:hypothetical protein